MRSCSAVRENSMERLRQRRRTSRKTPTTMRIAGHHCASSGRRRGMCMYPRLARRRSTPTVMRTRAPSVDIRIGISLETPCNNAKRTERLPEDSVPDPKPPFRADQGGSLLRPARLKEARGRVERGEMDAEALRELEDRLIRDVVAKQEALGLESVTDGELRRGWWNHDFLGKIDGVEIELDRKSYKFAGTDDPRFTAKVRRKVRRTRPMMVEHFRYLRSVAKNTPKFTIPSP